MPLTNDEYAKRTHLTIVCDNCGWQIGTSFFSESQIRPHLQNSSMTISMMSLNGDLWEMAIKAIEKHYESKHDVRLS